MTRLEIPVAELEEEKKRLEKEKKDLETKFFEMRQLYQNLVESSGGQFEYHGGYMHNGKRNPEERVKRYDLVICLVNGNSHGVCSNVKEICQKHRKPFKMLPSSSLSASSNILFESCVQVN